MEVFTCKNLAIFAFAMAIVFAILLIFVGLYEWGILLF